ncbi:MAG: UDP-4-amino-4,6-dideoxy-N-acetyl-beta-L-altrosamine N-acetyltransferase [Campylobacterales bacterium]
MFNRADFSLRPLQQADRERLLCWRNSDRVRENMYTDHLIGEDEHNAWFAKTLNDPAVWYRVFAHKDRPIGLTSLTRIENGSGFWGFYLGEPDAPAGCGAVMEWLSLEAAFDELGLSEVFCEVFAFNGAVIKLHRKFGFIETGSLERSKDGRIERAVALRLDRPTWAQSRSTLEKKLWSAE